MAAVKMKTCTLAGDTFQVPEDYTLVKMLGTGAYGTVAEFTDGLGKGVAVKKIANIFGDDDEVAQAKLILREITLLQHFEHENVCQLVSLLPPASTSFEEIYVVMALMDTDLHNILKSGQELSDEIVHFFSYQMLVGLKYLHSAKVVHRDMKPHNLLVNGDCSLRICDFGWSRVLEDADAQIQEAGTGPSPQPLEAAGGSGMIKRCLTTKNVVTLWYRAPEVVLSEKYSFGVDIFSAGCILAEIVASRALFKSVSAKSHVVMCLCVLGQPSADAMEKHFTMNEEDGVNMKESVKYANETDSDRYVKAWDATQKKTQWNLVFPNVDAATWTPELTTLLDRLLAFDPFGRASATEALELPYYADWHVLEEEPVCEQPIDWSFDSLELTMETVREAIYKVCTAGSSTAAAPMGKKESDAIPFGARLSQMPRQLPSDMPLAGPAFLGGAADGRLSSEQPGGDEGRVRKMTTIGSDGDGSDGDGD